MKRVLSLILVLAMCAVCFSACDNDTSNTDSNKTTKSISVIDSSNKAESEQSASSTETTITTSNDNSETSSETYESKADTKVSLPTITEQVLWEIDGIKITATDIIEDEIFGTQIAISVENNSNKDVGIGSDALIVNGYMLTDLIAFEVTAGNKAKKTIDLLSDELQAAGISHIGTIELYLHTYDPSSYETLKKSKCITIKTSDEDKAETTTNIKGTTLYEKNNIRIIGQYVDENSFWGASLLIYIENNTNKNITVSVDNVAVNGNMVNASCSKEVYPKRKAFTDITLFESDLEKNEIQSIDTIELLFEIYDSDTYDTIDKSGKIKIMTK